MATEYQKAEAAKRKALTEARRPMQVTAVVFLQDASAYDGSYQWQANFTGPEPETGKPMTVSAVALTVPEVMEQAGKAMMQFMKPGAPAGVKR